MKQYLCFLFFLTLAHTAVGHDVPVAHFTLFENEHLLELEMEFDKKSLETSIYKGKSPILDDSKRNQLIREYVNDHLSIFINGIDSSVEILKIEVQGHHFFIKAQIKKTSSPIKRIDFKTTCLLAENAQHNNILVADVNCKTRGFRLTKDRVAIEIVY